MSQKIIKMNFLNNVHPHFLRENLEFIYIYHTSYTLCVSDAIDSHKEVNSALNLEIFK